MKASAVDVCKSLGESIPDIRPILDEHIDDYDSILPHVFMADIARYVLSDGKQRAATVRMLEECFGGECSEVNDVIAVSFIGAFENEDELERAIGGVDSPRMRQEWYRQHSV